MSADLMNVNYQRFADSTQVEHVDATGVPVVHIPEITPQKTVPQIIASARRAFNCTDLHSFARLLVRELINKNTDEALSRQSEAQAVKDVVRFRIRYAFDPEGVELVYGAAVIFDMWRRYGKWAEDCDSTAGMVLALLWSLGHKCSVTLVGFDSLVPGFDHVFTETLLPVFGWRVVDPTEDRAIQMTREIAHFERFVTLPQ